MSRTVTLGTNQNLESVGSIAVVVCWDSQGGVIFSSAVQEVLLGLNLTFSVEGAWLKEQGLKEKVGSSLVVRSMHGANVIILSGGLGETISVDAWRKLAAAAARASAPRSGAIVVTGSAAVSESAAAGACVEGATLASYVYSLKDTTDEGDFYVVPVGDASAELRSAVANAQIIADTANWVKELCNLPAGNLPPQELARRALAELETRDHVRVDVWDEQRIAKENMGAFLDVNRGSDEPARLVYASYDPQPGAALAHVILVGKGVTFDSGGYSLKPPTGMIGMKSDMTGAAVVLGVVSAVAQLKLAVKVSAITPLTENMVNGRATRPGDVSVARNGTSIEVLNTDAEGRLILSDALVLATEAQPDLIVDVATLTGAQNVALGSEVAALFATSDDLASDFTAAGERAGESLWRLPLVDSYDAYLDSDVADVKNIGKAGEAGTIVAALFLRRFVSDSPWVHLDIAAPAESDANKGYLTKGSTAFSFRTIVEYLRTLSER